MRRLSVFSARDKERKLLVGIPPPLVGQGRSCSLAQVLEIACTYLGSSLGYDAIMALSGLALRTPQWPGDPEPGRDEWIGALNRLQDAIRWHAPVLGAGELPDSSAIMSAVVCAVDSGVPCIAFGWGSVKEHWSIISGYDRAQGLLAGHCLLSQPRDSYELWPPHAELLVPVSGRWQPPEDPASWLAHIAAQYPPGGCARWAEEVMAGTALPDTAQERALHLLADARAAAAGFAERVAEPDDSICSQWLAVATRYFYQLVDLVEATFGSLHPYSAGIDPGPAHRQAHAQRLQAIARLDQIGLQALRRAPEAQFPPGEDDP